MMIQLNKLDRQQVYDKYWRGGLDLTDAERLRPYVMAITEKVKHCLWRHEFGGAEYWRQVYLVARPFCQDEPLATPYDLGYMNICNDIGDTLIACRDIEKAYTLTRGVIDVLRSGDERREECGVGFRPNSEVRYNYLYTLAQCKWYGDDADRVMTPAQIVDEYVIVAKRVSSYLETNPLRKVDGGQNRGSMARIFETLGLAGIAVCKMAFKYLWGTKDKHPERKRVIKLIQTFNRTQPVKHLALKPGHFRSAGFLNPKSDWCAEYEAAKLFCTEAQLAPGDLELLFEQRKATKRFTMTQQRPTATHDLLLAWDHERMSRLASRRLEVLELNA